MPIWGRRFKVLIFKLFESYCFPYSDTNQTGPAAKKPKVEDGADFSMAGLAKGAVTEVSLKNDLKLCNYSKGIGNSWQVIMLTQQNRLIYAGKVTYPTTKLLCGVWPKC